MVESIGLRRSPGHLDISTIFSSDQQPRVLNNLAVLKVFEYPAGGSFYPGLVEPWPRQWHMLAIREKLKILPHREVEQDSVLGRTLC